MDVGSNPISPAKSVSPYLGEGETKMNRYRTSKGELLTQAQIDYRRGQAYERFNKSHARPHCWGCEENRATGFAHIIPQARCKTLHQTELIWDLGNFFPACNDCNLAIENPKGEAWKQLKNKEWCLAFIEMHDKELYQKFMNNR